MTLAQAIPDVIGAAEGPTAVTLIVEETTLINVGVATEAEDVLILALPDYGENAVLRLTADVEKVLRFRYKSLGSAFKAKNPARVKDLDDFFAVILLEEIWEKKKNRRESRFDDLIGGGNQWFPLPDEVRFSIDDALNQFESGDFRDFSADFHAIPREFDILGSCIFHR